MDWRRIAELRAPGTHGSGYVLAANLVLTARHVVDGHDHIDVRLLTADANAQPGSAGEWQPMQVAWRSATIDAALLVADGSVLAPRVTPARIGRLESQASLPVLAVGFPRFIAAASHSDMLHLRARTDALTAVRAGVLRLVLEAGNRPPDATGWRGMSGAAVWAGDILVGVLQAVPAGVAASALEALRAHRLLEDPVATALLEKAGVDTVAKLVDAAYVDALPRVGHWRDVRDAYVRAVVESRLTVDHVGLEVAGAAPWSMPALDAYATRFTLRSQLAKADGSLDTEWLGKVVRLGPSALQDLVGRKTVPMSAVAATPCAVLAGEGGAGKSTALKQLLAHAARDELKVPVWVDLAKLGREKRYRVDELLDHLVKDSFGVKEVNPEFFKSLADAGQLVIGFDALDECGELGSRQGVSKLVADVAQSWLRCRVVVTSRPDALRETPLPLAVGKDGPQFVEYGIAPFTPDDIEPFLTVAFDNGAEIAKHLPPTGIEAMTQTPLMLTLVGLVVGAGGAVTFTTRAQLFAQCMATVAETWENAKPHGDPGDGLASEQRLDVLRRLGWEVQVRGGDDLSAVDAVGAISAADGVHDRAACKRVLRGLARRNVILRANTGGGANTEVKSLRFSHTQFREYLAGAHVAQSYQHDAAATEQAMAPHWLDSGWLDVLRFAVGTLADESKLRDGLLVAVLRADDPWRDLLHRPEFVAARLLARLPYADPGLVERVVATLEQATLAEPALRDLGAERLLALSQHPAAVPAIERFARGSGVAAAFGDLKDDAAFKWRLRAIAAIARARGQEIALPLLLALPAREWDRLGAVTETRATLGDRQGAIDAMHRRFTAAADDFRVERVLETMDAIDETATANGWLAKRIAKADVLPISRATLAHKRGLLPLDSPRWTPLFDDARKVLEASPHAESAAQDVMGSVYAVFELGATTPAARALAETALRHPATTWVAGPRALAVFPDLRPIAVSGMTDYVLMLIERSKVERLNRGVLSRFNGTLHTLLNVTDAALAVPALERLLRQASVREFEWQRIAEALTRYGKAALPLALLQPLVELPAAVHDSARDERESERAAAWRIADQLDPATARRWLRERYLAGDPVAAANRLMSAWNVSGIAGVARGWFEAMAADERDAAGRAFLKQLTTHERDTAFTDFARQALYGGVFDEPGKRDIPEPAPATAEEALARLHRLRRMDADLARRHDSDDTEDERDPARAFCKLLRQVEPLLGRDVAVAEAEHWLDAAVTPIAENDVRVERLLSRLDELVYAGVPDARWPQRAAEEARRVEGDNRTALVEWLAHNV